MTTSRTLAALATITLVCAGGSATSAHAQNDDGRDTTPTCDGQPATIVGTVGDDLLVGTPECDVIVAMGGSDLVRGRGGDDLICLGPIYTDTLLETEADLPTPRILTQLAFGGAGDDVIFGGKDLDIIYGGPGADTLRGRGFQDQLHGENGTDQLFGGAGPDLLYGHRHADLLFGGPNHADLPTTCTEARATMS